MSVCLVLHAKCLSTRVVIHRDMTSLLLAATYWLRPVLCVSNAAGWCPDMIRVAEGTTGRSTKPKPSQRSTLTSVLQYLGESQRGSIVADLIFLQGRCNYQWPCLCCVVLESRPVPHVQRSHRTPGLQVQPPRRLLSSLPSHGPLGMLGKRSYHHSSRMDPERRANASGQGAEMKHEHKLVIYLIKWYIIN